MTTWGTTHCNNYATMTTDQKIASSQYDRQRIFYQIADYTGTGSYLTCAETAGNAYRDLYVIPNNGGIPPHLNWSDGLRMDWERNADSSSRSAINLLRNNGAYCTVNYAGLTGSVRYDAMREISACLEAHLNAEAVGHTPSSANTTAKNALVEALFGAYDDIYVSKTARCTNAGGCRADGVPQNYYFLHPFMVGIASEMMIRLYNLNGESRTYNAVKTMQDELWERAWNGTANPSDKHYWYINWTNDGTPTGTWLTRTGASDLNQFNCYPLMWLYSQGAGTTYRDRADECFTGGVTQSLGEQGAKQFNEAYRTSFSTVQLREAAVAPVIGVSGVLPSATEDVSYSYTIPVTGGTQPYTACDETSGALPTGLTSTPVLAGCLIEGTPTVADTFVFTERVTATGGLTDSEAGLTIVVAATVPIITTVSMNNGTVDAAFSQTIVCEGGTAPYSFSVVSGALCLGLSLNSSSGAVTGTPTVPGSCAFTVRCTDADTDFDDQTLTHIIDDALNIGVSTNAASTSVVFQYGYSGLTENTFCQVTVKEGSQVIEVATSSAGRSSREMEIGLLTPETMYNATFTCTTSTNETTEFFTTLVESSGAQTVPFQVGAPPTILAGAERLTMQCDDDPGMSSPVSAQDTSVGSGASLSLSLTPGIWYCRHRWQTAADVILVTSPIRAIPIP